MAAVFPTQFVPLVPSSVHARACRPRASRHQSCPPEMGRMRRAGPEIPGMGVVCLPCRSVQGLGWRGPRRIGLALACRRAV